MKQYRNEVNHDSKNKKIFSFMAAALLTASSVLGCGIHSEVQAEAASKAPKKIVMNKKSVKLSVGKTYKLKVKKVTPKGASKAVSYKSNKKKIVAVSNKGVVRAVKAGKAKITVTSKKNKKIKAVVNVTVTASKSKKTSAPSPTAAVTPPSKATGSPMPSASAAPQRLSMSDLKKLKAEGKVEYVLNDRGNVTWLSGDFYNGTVTDEDGVKSVINALRNVLGVSENTKFIHGARYNDDNGNLFYTVKQYRNGISVLYAVAKVITDKNHRVVGVSSSFNPDADTAENVAISESEAIAVVEKHLSEKDPETEYTFYRETVDKVILDFSVSEEAAGTSEAYVVYTNNPSPAHPADNKPFIAHYVAGNGQYLYNIPITSIGDEDAQSGTNAVSFFKGKKRMEYTGEVTLHDGTKKSVTVPVLYDEASKTYFLADDERKMAVMDFPALFIHGKVEMETSKNNKDWDNKKLITYSNYIKVYDAFASFGWYSTDGLGTPLALTSGYCDEDGTPKDNAAFVGMSHGWNCLASSPLNDHSECIDVLAHEYTHGVTSASLCESPYSGVTGAINESFSDIVGNLIEKKVTGREDKNWDVAEDTGKAMRSMRNPHDYFQPAFVGDMYFVPTNADPLGTNDQSGVHINNSLLSGVCVDLADAGMTVDEQLQLWLTTELSMVSLTGYQELLPILKLTTKLCGLEKYEKLIEDTYRNRGLTQNLNNVVYADAPGGGKAVFHIAPSEHFSAECIFLINPETHEPVTTSWVAYPDKSGKVTIPFNEGRYNLALLVRSKENPKEIIHFFYTGDGWKYVENESEAAVVELKYGKPLELADVK